jgi:hypothetical protein
MCKSHHQAWRTRSLHRWTLLAALALTLGCGRDQLAPSEPATLQPRPNVALDILQGLGLELLPGPVPTYYSPGYRERAEELQAWLQGADAFFQKRLKIAPAFHLAVLAPEHWAALRAGPYGVPFFTDAPRVVVMPAIPEQSVVTQIYSAAQVALPADAAAKLAALGVSYQDAVFQVVDLIGFHEVGHVYIAELGYDYPNSALWLMELLATYAAYSYLAFAQPSSIVMWDALSEAILGFVEPNSRSLDDFNTIYGGLGPATYGWFQSHFNLRDAVVVKQRPLATWFNQLAAHGFNKDTRAIPTSEPAGRARSCRGCGAWRATRVQRSARGSPRQRGSGAAT